MSEWLIAVLLGLVEGMTEFVPVSSTGHLILAGHALGFEGERAATFEIFIQLGAILAVAVLYWQRFLRLLPTHPPEGFAGWRGIGLLLVTSLPALLLGLVAHEWIKETLFNPFTVALGLGIGGVAIIVLERALSGRGKRGLDTLTWREAALVGLFQCLALWPGVSRSAATIIGGMVGGVSRETATEYSFFAAVPVLGAAAVYDLLSSLDVLQPSDIPIFAIGFVVAFISALAAIRTLIRFLGHHTLAPFGWYRIALALLVLLVLR